MRIKRGTTKNKKHKKILKLAKGYRMTYSKLYRRANEAVLHAGSYSHAHRKRRKSQKRREWISTIAASLAGTDTSYSTLIHKMKKKGVEIDRKNLALMAESRPDHFKQLVDKVTK